MANKDERELPPTYSDITHWIFDCNRYLFLAKVQKLGHKVNRKNTVDPVALINRLSNADKLKTDEATTHNKLIFQKIQNENYAIPKIIELTIDIPIEDIEELKRTVNETVKAISKNKINDIDIDKVRHSQKILLEYLNQIDLALQKNLKKLQG